MATTKKAAGKKGSSKKRAAGGSSKKGAGQDTPAAALQIGSATRVQIDRAAQTIARAVEGAIARQQLPGGRIRGPIIVGIWIDPITKRVQVVNQLEQ